MHYIYILYDSSGRNLELLISSCSYDLWPGVQFCEFGAWMYIPVPNVSVVFSRSCGYDAASEGIPRQTLSEGHVALKQSKNFGNI